VETGGNRNNTLRFGTWNITSLTGKEMEIVEEMKRFHIPILGIGEVKKKGTGGMKLKDNYTCRYVEADKRRRAKEKAGIIRKDKKRQMKKCNCQRTT
jgi:hypothetical protein